MDAADALLAAVRAAPADDVPRLVFADFLEEAGDPGYAAFVRHQVEYARHPAWSAAAARLRRDVKGVETGHPFAGRRPLFTNDFAFMWDDTPSLHRGFARGVIARDAAVLAAAGRTPFDAAPIDTLVIQCAGTRTDVRGVADSDWLRNVRRLAFRTTASPAEWLRECADAGHLVNLRSLAFDPAQSVALPEILDRFFAAPAAADLEELHLGTSNAAAADLLHVLAKARLPRLHTLTVRTMNLWGRPMLERLLRLPVARGLTRLDLGRNLITMSDTPELGEPVAADPPPGLLSLNLDGCRVSTDELVRLRRVLLPPTLKELDLTGNGLRSLAEEGFFAALPPGLERLTARLNTPDDAAALRNAPCWDSLVELDLLGPAISDRTLKALAAVGRPPKLERLVVREGPLPNRLLAVYAGAV